MNEIAEHLPAMRRYALSLTRNPVDADDVVQDASERALASWGSIDPERDLGAWLNRIVHNEFCRRYRRTQRRAEVQVDSPIERNAGDMRNDVARMEAKQQIDTVLGSLDAPRREVVERVYGLGETVAEVAVAMGTPVGTVCTRLYRARRVLKDALGEFESARGGAGVDMARREPAERVQADADGVDGVVRAGHEHALDL